MPTPINLKLDAMSMSSSEKSSVSAPSPSYRRKNKPLGSPPQPTDTFWKRHGQKFKKEVGVSGTFYNMTTASLVTFIGVFLILSVFRVPFIMTTPPPSLEDPDPTPCISWMSVLVWSLVLATGVFAIAFFTRPKPAPAYVLEK